MFGIDAFSSHSDPDVSLSGTPAQRFNFSFLHYVDPDKSGHSDGWPSDLYFETLRQADDYIGDLLAAIESDPILNGRTTLIVVTDHGGGNPFTHHNVSTDPLNYKVPLFVWGAGAPAATELYDANMSTRTDPGTAQLDYDLADMAGQPIRNSDSGNLALSLLGLPSVPGSTVNSLQDLALEGCGDGNIAPGEACDDGASNGTTPCGCTLGCTYPDNLTSCDDGDVCTAADLCDGAGACSPGAPVDPDDGNACTADS